MDVEFGSIPSPHAVSAYVGLVRQNQRGGNRIHRRSRLFVVVANRRDDNRDFLRIHAHAPQNRHRHDRATVRVVGAVDDVSDIVQITGDFRELCVTLRIAELQEYVLRGLRDLADVREAVLGEPEGDQRFVLFLDVGVYRLVRLYFFYSYHTQLLI